MGLLTRELLGIESHYKVGQKAVSYGSLNQLELCFALLFVMLMTDFGDGLSHSLQLLEIFKRPTLF